MLSNGFLELIDGCLSTGKEANVYYAKAGRIKSGVTSLGDGSVSSSSFSNATFAPLLAPDVTEYAIKIYKTSILVFKDRDKYVSGEHRWRKGYCELFY
jgi:RIO kinase 1